MSYEFFFHVEADGKMKRRDDEKEDDEKEDDEREDEDGHTTSRAYDACRQGF